ncbi:coiled-coil domain-containing protein 86 isoform X1 [Rissa tridactyla]|uniref:coiled-coil domain-containing protein 86 isoform X1 n=1 Tax=Rissa tridactyla TaxID=75485 RepID=UPI0023BA5FCA|nr:coiled-coil domain-containing protein 86 isoform X1 [Rissa tridactyla]
MEGERGAGPGPEEPSGEAPAPAPARRRRKAAKKRKEAVAAIPRGRPKSGRVWKDPGKKRFSHMIQDKALRTSWARKMKERQERKLVRDLARQLQEGKQREREGELGAALQSQTLTGDFPPLSIHNSVSLPPSWAPGSWHYCGRALHSSQRAQTPPAALLLASWDSEFPVVLPNLRRSRAASH